MELSHSCEFQFPMPTHLWLQVTSGKVAISLLTGLYSEADAPRRYFGAACLAWVPSPKNAVNGKKVASVPLPAVLAETNWALGDSRSWEQHCPAKTGVSQCCSAGHWWCFTGDIPQPSDKCSTGFSDHWTPGAPGLGKVRQGLGMGNVYPAAAMVISFPTKQERTVVSSHPSSRRSIIILQLDAKSWVLKLRIQPELRSHRTDDLKPSAPWSRQCSLCQHSWSPWTTITQDEGAGGICSDPLPAGCNIPFPPG